MHFLSEWSVLIPLRSSYDSPKPHEAAAAAMDISRRQGNSGYVDVSRRRVPTKRQAAAAVTDFVLRRAKAFRGERGPQASPGQTALGPPRGPAAQAKSLRGRGTAPHEGTMTGGEGVASATDAELPPPSMQLPMGTLHGAAVGMASFMASGGRERPATLMGSPAGRAQGADTATVEPFRLGLDGSSAAVSPVDAPEEPLIRTRRDNQFNPAEEGGGGIPLAASLAATLFPPEAPSHAGDGVAVGGEAAGRVGRRTSIFGRP